MNEQTFDQLAELRASGDGMPDRLPLDQVLADWRQRPETGPKKLTLLAVKVNGVIKFYEDEHSQPPKKAA